MAIKLKRNPVAFASAGGTAGEWVTEDGRFYIQDYGKKGWTIYAEEVKEFQALRAHELEGKYFRTRKEALTALEEMIISLDSSS
jgi:hypothetical protein